MQRQNYKSFVTVQILMGLTVCVEEKARLKEVKDCFFRLSWLFVDVVLMSCYVISLTRHSRLPPTPACILTNSHPQTKPHLSSFLFHVHQTCTKTSKQHCLLSCNIPILNHSTPSLTNESILLWSPRSPLVAGTSHPLTTWHSRVKRERWSSKTIHPHLYRTAMHREDLHYE